MEIKKRVQTAKIDTETRVVNELHRNHWGLMAGLGSVAIFGLLFLGALYRSVMRPIQSMKSWADRVARGEKGLAMTAFTGKNELTELALSIGEMAIQLTRPKAHPTPLVPKGVPVVSPAPITTVSVPSPAPPPPSLSPPTPVDPAPEQKIDESNSFLPVPPVSAPPPAEDFENAVNEFRDILTLMSGKDSPPRSK